MRALVFDGAPRLDHDYPTPRPAPGEALVRVTLAGICNTDLEITKGYMGFRGVLGHEFVGVVQSAPEGEWVGRRVVGEINCPCGACHYCREGLGNHCQERTVLGIVGRDGAFADFLHLPVANLHAVPDSVSDEEAVFAEPLAAALQILEQVHVRPTDEVVVLGDGKLGLLVAQVLALAGCRVLAMGKHATNLALLRERGIATAFAGDHFPVGADLVVECTGRAEGLALAQRIVRPRGTIVLKSTYAPNAAGRTPAHNLFVVHEVAVVGSRCGPFAPALRILERHLIDVTPMVAARHPLDDAPAALARAAEHGRLKVLLQAR